MNFLACFRWFKKKKKKNYFVYFFISEIKNNTYSTNAYAY